MQLREIMTKDVEVIRPDATLFEAAKLMQRHDVGAVPVCDGARLQGMLTDRDIAIRAVAEGRDPFTTLVRDVMTSEVVYGTEKQDVNEAAELMEREQIRRLVVLDDDRNLAGIVSLGDIATQGGSRRLSGETLEAISQPGAPSAVGASGIG
jgi:CBS domain-containing protein